MYVNKRLVILGFWLPMKLSPANQFLSITFFCLFVCSPPPLPPAPPLTCVWQVRELLERAAEIVVRIRAAHDNGNQPARSLPSVR
jgi:hypothetical protein